MFGHKWERAQATVVEARADNRSPAGTLGGHEYIVDVRKPTGEVFRASIRHPGGINPPAVGTVISVEFEAKTGNVRFDPRDHKLSLGAVASALKVAEQLGFQAAGDPGGTTTPADPAGSAGAGRPGSGEAAAAGPMQQALLAALQNRAAGAQAMAGPEAGQMLQSLMSGDRNQRAAAIAQLRQLRASGGLGALAGGLAAQASPPGTASPPSPAGGPAPSTFDPAPPPAAPSTFDPIGSTSSPSSFPQSDQSRFPASNPSTFSQPGNPSTFGPIGTPAASSKPSTFDPIGAPSASSTPSTFDPISPINTFSNPGSSFSGVGGSNKTERIARLQALRDQGLLSNQDFETQRQQIIDEF